MTAAHHKSEGEQAEMDPVTFLSVNNMRVYDPRDWLVMCR